MNIKKKQLLLSLTIIFLLTFNIINVFSYESSSNNKISVTPKELSFNSESFEITMKIPIISGMKDTTSQQALNKNFESYSMKLKSIVENLSKSYAEEAKKEGYAIRPYIFSSDYTVNYNKNNILSLTREYYEYTGGAHGNYHHISDNIDLETGKNLSLSDLFKPKSNYKDIIMSEIKNQIASNKQLYFNSAEKDISNISSKQSLYITDDGIVIYYSLYEIAPYSTGIPEFKIPFNVLKDVLKYNFM